MSDDIKIGSLLRGTEGRDATHIALAPVQATQILSPGDHIGLLPGSSTEVAAAGNAIPYHGIVDPFLYQHHVLVGDWFYMWLVPGTVTGMRHQWEHPAFAHVGPENAHQHSINWITAWASGYGLSYAEVMRNADTDQWYAGIDEGRDIPDEFWDHYQIIRGHVPDNRSSYWRCAC